jgi:hypothetical protein
MEANRRWQQKYDLLKEEHMREKLLLEKENQALKMEVSRLKELTSRGNGNVDQLIIKVQVLQVYTISFPEPAILGKETKALG